ncbi:MAG: hypothetical protein QM679_00935 [Patulibacter sp.]
MGEREGAFSRRERRDRSVVPGERADDQVSDYRSDALFTQPARDAGSADDVVARTNSDARPGGYVTGVQQLDQVGPKALEPRCRLSDVMNLRDPPDQHSRFIDADAERASDPAALPCRQNLKPEPSGYRTDVAGVREQHQRRCVAGTRFRPRHQHEVGALSAQAPSPAC